MTLHKDLSPCPFCGSDDVRHDSWGTRWPMLMVTCRTCYARGPSLIDGERLDEEEARLSWNLTARQAEIGADLITAALARPDQKEVS